MRIPKQLSSLKIFNLTKHLLMQMCRHLLHRWEDCSVEVLGGNMPQKFSVPVRSSILWQLLISPFQEDKTTLCTTHLHLHFLLRALLKLSKIQVILQLVSVAQDHKSGKDQERKEKEDKIYFGSFPSLWAGLSAVHTMWSYQWCGTCV